MHIEFKLPSGAGEQAAHYGCTVLNQELARWSSVYGFGYTTVVTHYKMTVRFEDDRAYTLFALCWPNLKLQWRLEDD